MRFRSGLLNWSGFGVLALGLAGGPAVAQLLPTQAFPAPAAQAPTAPVAPAPTQPPAAIQTSPAQSAAPVQNAPAAPAAPAANAASPHKDLGASPVPAPNPSQPGALAPSSQPAPSSAAPAQTAPPAPPPAATNIPSSNQPAVGAPGAPKPDEPMNAEAAGQPIEVAARPVVGVRGSATWEDSFKNIVESLSKARAAAAKAGLKENGRPLTAFLETDDNGIKFEAMIPVEVPVNAKPDLGADAHLTETPSGRAYKFQHRGAYDDVDSTYEAITAYLDEKGLEAKNIYIEEYINDAKGPDDMDFALDIYVFVK